MNDSFVDSSVLFDMFLVVVGNRCLLIGFGFDVLKNDVFNGSGYIRDFLRDISFLVLLSFGKMLENGFGFVLFDIFRYYIVLC